MVKYSKAIGIAFFSIVILSFAVLAGFAIVSPSPSSCSSMLGNKEKEGFQVNATKASECRCLDGYIPSNRINNENGGTFWKYQSFIVFQPHGTMTKHYVSNCLTCSNVNPCSTAKPILKAKWDSLQWGPSYTCAILAAAKKATGTKSSIFFCQSLSDKEITRSCY